MDRILLGHGSGGRMMYELIREYFVPEFGLKSLNDSAVLQGFNHRRLAVTTDSYVASPEASALEESDLSAFRSFFRGLLAREADCSEVFVTCERLVETIAGIRGYRGVVDERLLETLEIIEQISEIAMGQGLNRLAILNSPEVREILENPRLNHRQMTQGLRDLLWRRRFPRLYARKERFQESLGRCHLPPKIRLQHPPAFEGGEWQLQVLYSGPSELRELLGVAKQLADSPRLAELMTPGGGGSEPDPHENPP